MKPRELLRLVFRRPVAAGLALGAVALGFGRCLAAGLWLRLGRPDAVPGAAVHCDWAKVAEEIIARQEREKASIPPATAPQPLNPRRIPPGAGAGFFPLLLSGRAVSAAAPAAVVLPPRGHDVSFQPCVAGKRIFAAGCQTDLGGYTGLLACIDSETGKPLWQVTQLAGEDLRPFFSSPALTSDGKYLVIGQGLHSDRDCSLLCFEAETGRLHWAVKTPLHVESSPAILGNMAVVGAGAIEGPDGKAVGDPGFVLAVRIDDGQVLWRQPVNDPESSPAIDDARHRLHRQRLQWKRGRRDSQRVRRAIGREEARSHRLAHARGPARSRPRDAGRRPGGGGSGQRRRGPFEPECARAGRGPGSQDRHQSAGRRRWTTPCWERSRFGRAP